MVDAPDTEPLLDLLRDDTRVHGVARLASSDGRLRLVVATTWDGLEPIVARLPELAATVVPLDDAVVVHDGNRIDVLTPGGARLEIRATRIGDLKPAAEGEGALPLLDPQGVLAQWADWSAGRPRPEPEAGRVARAAAVGLLGVDDALRALTNLPPGSRLATTGGPAPLRHALATLLRARVAGLPDVPGAAALQERVDDALFAMPHDAAGLRVSGPDARERFLAVADEEGFRGDRVLLDRAEDQMRAAGLSPVFEVGFALATFDQVEARYALGQAVGGCKPPLVPGLLVGVEVTPADSLGLWAAPSVREPVCDAACIADDGGRTVVSRDAGRDALLGALDDAVHEAVETLPGLLRRARGAHRERPDDPEALLATLHLPRSHVVAAGEQGALAPGATRLTMALMVARAATDMEPVVARKLELAAGRLLLGAPETDDCAM